MGEENVIKTNNLSVKQTEDTWAWVEIGEPFPDGPIKAKGAMNEYVALWYKHGSPICGRAWNNSGVVECAFGYKGKELSGKQQLGGKIQILTYDQVPIADPVKVWDCPQVTPQRDAWQACGYVYIWVKWKDRRQPHLQMVRCGDSAPIMMRGKDNKDYCGNVSLSSETVTIAYDGKAEEKTLNVGDMFTIVRNLKCPPPPSLTHEDTWLDLREGDPFTRCSKAVMALNRSLKTPFGPRKCYAALWYRHGNPVMGTVYEGTDGKLAAVFSYDGHEFTKHCGSLQVLAYDSDLAAFKIDWIPYADVVKADNKKWHPYKVNDCAPAVIKLDNGNEMLGRVQMSEEKAGCANGDGNEAVLTGPAVHKVRVLCRTH